MKIGMVVGVLIMVLIVAGVLFQRSRAAAGQGPALHLSEAGVNYVLHLLNSGTCTLPELIAQQPLVQTVPATAGTAAGAFSASFFVLDAPTPSRVQVMVVGHGEGATACGSTDATLEAFSGLLGTKYRVVTWDQGSAACGEPTAVRPLSCRGAAAH